MAGSLVLYTVPLGLAALISIVLGYYGYRRNTVPGSRYFALLMAAVSIWSVMAILTYLSPTLSGKIFWTNLQYVGITLVPLAWLGFSLTYTGNGAFLGRAQLALLSVHPVAMQIVIWTNPVHGFFRREVWLDTAGSVPALGFQMGPAFWMHALYSYTLLLVGAYVLVRAQFRAPRIYRSQGTALFIAVLAPWIANVVTLATAGPLAFTDLTPFAFTVSGAALTWGLLRYRLFDLVPIAQDAVLANLSSGVAVLDLDDRVVDLNPAGAAIFGLAQDEVIGRKLGEVSSHYRDLIGRYTSVGEVREEVTMEKGGHVQVFDLSIAPLYDTHEELVGRLVNVQDITEYRETQRALVVNAEQLRILHEIDQAILAAQSSQTIASAALERIPHLIPVERMSVVVYDSAGVPRQLCTRSTGRLTADASLWEGALASHLYDAPEGYCCNYLPCEAEGHTSIEQQLAVNGVRAYLVMPLIVQGDVKGLLSLEATRTAGFTASHVDMIHQIATSLAVALENARLYAAAQQELEERKLAESALVESEAALRRQTEDLTARNAELDAFAHTVAHDLKTPLSLLIGYTSFLEAGGADGDRKTMALSVRSIGQSARKMSNIIDELLLLASVRKVQELELRPLDMHAIVGDVLVRMTDLIDADRAQISLPEQWPIAAGYAPWIEEVWANYISNALKYGGTPPHIELGATVKANGDGNGPAMVRYWVRDDGDGLAPEQQAKLFIPFERLNQARAKGYGLGLSIVQRIMERLGGVAGVESAGTPGAGSTFYFELPEADF